MYRGLVACRYVGPEDTHSFILHEDPWSIPAYFHCIKYLLIFLCWSHRITSKQGFWKPR